MTRLAAILVFLTLGLGPAGVAAAERFVVLKVDNMTCVLCPYTVQKALEGVGGAKKVWVSLEKGTATVVYEDGETTAAELAQASTDAGYPAAPIAQ